MGRRVAGGRLPGPERPGGAQWIPAFVLGRRAGNQPHAHRRGLHGWCLAGALAGRSGGWALRRSLAVGQFREPQAGICLGQVRGTPHRSRCRARPLPAIRTLVERLLPAQPGGDRGHRREPLHRRSRRAGHVPYMRMLFRRSTPGTQPVGHFRVLGGQHHAAAPGAGMDRLGLQEHGRTQGRRPAYRLPDQPACRPPGDLRLGQGRAPGASSHSAEPGAGRGIGTGPVRDAHRQPLGRCRCAPTFLFGALRAAGGFRCDVCRSAGRIPAGARLVRIQ